MSYSLYEEIIMKRDSYCLKKGEIGIFAGHITSSGHSMVQFVAKNKDFYKHLKKNNHNTFLDYIEFQKKESYFGTDFWTNPFDVTSVYEEDITSIKKLRSKQDLIKSQILELNKSYDETESLIKESFELNENGKNIYY